MSGDHDELSTIHAQARLTGLKLSCVQFAPAISAKSRLSCDRLGGKTLAANERVRLFRIKAGRPAGTHVRACSYRSGRTSDLWFDDRYAPVPPEPRLFTWAINGDFVALSISQAGSLETTDRAFGLSSETTVVWNGRTRRKTSPASSFLGLRFTEIVVSPTGSVGAIGNPYGLANQEDGSRAPLTTSSVQVYTPGAAWRSVATTAVGGLSGLTLSTDRLLWVNGAEVQQTPLK